jgi:deazaflavin-dependent oxidoreductase (nitroreductase family)
VAVFPSEGGAASNPDWYYNLVAHPDVRIEFGSGTSRAVAPVATGAERERVWRTQKARHPNFAGYERTARGRQTPVVVLDPA